MFNRIKQAACFLSIGAVAIVGCSNETAVNTAAPSPAAPVLSAGVPQTPEAAVQAVVDGLKASKPIALWDAMTEAHHEKINKTIRDAVAAADPEVWQRTVANLKKLVEVAETKKDFILQSPLVRTINGLKAEDLKKSWDPGLKLVKTIIQSELVDQEKMKNFDGRAFLEGTGAKLLVEARALSRTLKDDPLNFIDHLKVDVKKVSNRFASATVAAIGPKGQPIEILLTVGDGKWTTNEFLLISLAMNSLLSPLNMRFRPYYLLEWKDGYLAEMQQLGKTLDQLQAAKTSDQFQSVVSRKVLPYLLQKRLQFTSPPKPPTILETQSLNRPSATAMVMIKGDHFADEPGMLELSKLFREVAAEGKGETSGPFTFQDTMVFFVRPVSDTTALSKKIHLAKVIQVDVKRNKILLELPTSAAGDKPTAKADRAS